MSNVVSIEQKAGNVPVVEQQVHGVGNCAFPAAAEAGEPDHATSGALHRMFMPADQRSICRNWRFSHGRSGKSEFSRHSRWIQVRLFIRAGFVEFGFGPLDLFGKSGFPAVEQLVDGFVGDAVGRN